MMFQAGNVPGTACNGSVNALGKFLPLTSG
jgi:hypothetical protein